MLDGATGDAIGKVVDDLHYEFMRKFIEEHPKDGGRLNNYLRKMESSGKPFDRSYAKRALGEYMRVTPVWLDQKMTAKLAEPIILEQIATSKRVYEEARQVMASLHDRKDDASGIVAPEYPTQPKQVVRLE